MFGYFPNFMKSGDGDCDDGIVPVPVNVDTVSFEAADSSCQCVPMVPPMRWGIMTIDNRKKRSLSCSL